LRRHHISLLFSIGYLLLSEQSGEIHIEREREKERERERERERIQ